MSRQFQIKGSDKTTLTLNQVDEIVAKFWNREIDPKQWAEPSDDRFAMNWFDSIGWTIATNPASINFKEIASNFSDMYGFNAATQPHIDLALHFEELGLIPVCC